MADVMLNTQVNVYTADIANSDYSVEQLVFTVEMLQLHDQRDTLPVAERAAVEIWQERVYFTLPLALRDVAEATAQVLREQRFESMYGREVR